MLLKLPIYKTIFGSGINEFLPIQQKLVLFFHNFLMRDFLKTVRGKKRRVRATNGFIGVVNRPSDTKTKEH